MKIIRLPVGRRGGEFPGAQAVVRKAVAAREAFNKKREASRARSRHDRQTENSDDVWKLRRTDLEIGRHPIPAWALETVCHLDVGTCRGACCQGEFSVAGSLLRREGLRGSDVNGHAPGSSDCGTGTPCFQSSHPSWVTCDKCEVILDWLLECNVVRLEKERRVWKIVIVSPQLVDDALKKKGLIP